MKQDYPMMIYHIELEQNRVVKNKDELKQCEADGWTKNYKAYSANITIQKKIEYYESEIARLTKLLHNVDYEVAVDDTELIVDTTEEVEPLDEPEKSEVTPQKKGRGRPKKEA